MFLLVFQQYLPQKLQLNLAHRLHLLIHYCPNHPMPLQPTHLRLLQLPQLLSLYHSLILPPQAADSLTKLLVFLHQFCLLQKQEKQDLLVQLPLHRRHQAQELFPGASSNQENLCLAPLLLSGILLPVYLTTMPNLAANTPNNNR